jgi:hypothetical protein
MYDRGSQNFISDINSNAMIQYYYEAVRQALYFTVEVMGLSFW